VVSPYRRAPALSTTNSLRVARMHLISLHTLKQAVQRVVESVGVVSWKRGLMERIIMVRNIEPRDFRSRVMFNPVILQLYLCKVYEVSLTNKI